MEADIPFKKHRQIRSVQRYYLLVPHDANGLLLILYKILNVHSIRERACSAVAEMQKCDA